MSASLTTDSFYLLLGLRELRPDERERIAEAARQKAARKLAKTNAKTSEKQHKTLLTETKDKVKYEDRLARSKAALEEIRQYEPATTETVAAFVKAHAAADMLAGTGKYAEALERLHDVHVKGAEDKAETQFKEAVTKAEKKFPEVFAVKAQVDAKMRANNLTDAARNLFVQKEWAAISPLYAKAPTKEAGTKALADIRTTLNELGQADQAATLLRTHATTKLGAATAEATRLTGPITDGHLANLQRQLRDAETLRGEREYAAAIVVLDALMVDAANFEAAAVPGRDEWVRRSAAGEVRTLISEIGVILGDSKNSPPATIAEEGSALRARLEALATETPPQSTTFQDAVNRLTQVSTQLLALKQREAEYKAFSKTREAARLLVKDALENAETALAALQRAVLTADPDAEADAADGSFRERLKQAAVRWEACAKAAHNEETLKVEATLDGIQTIAADIRATAADPVKVSAKLDDAALAEARKQFAAAHAEAKAAIERVVAQDVDAGEKLLGQLAAIKTRADAATTAGKLLAPQRQAAMLRDKANTTADAAAGEIGELQTELAGRVAAAQAELDRMFREVEKIRQTKRQSDFAKLHQALTNALANQRAMVRVTQTELLEAALQELMTLEQDVAHAVGAIADEDDDEVLTFDAMRVQLNKLKTKLGEQEVKTFMGNTAFDLGEELKALEKSIGSESLTALRKKYDALAQKVTQIQADTKTARTAYDTFKAEVETLRKRLDNAAFKDAPKLKAELAAAIDQLRPTARAEGGLIAAQANRADIDQQITGLLSDPAKDARGVPQAMATAEADAVKTERGKEVQAVQWEADRKVLEARIERLPSFLAGEKKGIASLLSDADTTFKKAGDYGVAMEQMKIVRNRVQLFEQNPQGLLVSARNKLPQVRAFWRNAIGKFKAGTEAVDKAVQALPDTDLGPSAAACKAAVSKELARVAMLFNPAVFDAAIAVMTDPGTDKAEKSAARELALRDVRRIRSYIDDDFRLFELKRTPFSGTMAGLVSDLKLCLVDLETNMMISL